MSEQKMDVRHLVRSKDESTIAAGAFERTTQVWELKTLTKVLTLNTIFDSGGRRLALSNDGKFLFAASHSKKALACYAIPSGEVVWLKRGIGAVQCVTPSVTGRELQCELDTGRCLIVDIRSGERGVELKRITEVFEASDGQRRLLVGNSLFLWKSGGGEIDLQVHQPLLLDAAFGPREVCVSFLAGPCVCFDSSDGRRSWEYQSPAGSHVQELMYSDKDDCFYGVEWAYHRGRDRFLVHINRRNGGAVGTMILDAPGTSVFLPLHNRLLTSHGDIIDVSTRETVSTLEW